MIERYHQHFLPQLEIPDYPSFREITRNNEQLQQNLVVASVLPTNSQFLHYEEKDQNLSLQGKIAQIAEGVAISSAERTTELDRTDLDELFEMFSVECECGNPATTVNFCESCGGSKYCEGCFDYDIQSDYNCSPECYAQNHRGAVTISEAELERLVPRVEVSMEEVRKTEKQTVFLVNVRRRTPEEIEELKLEIALDYIISDWPSVIEVNIRDGLAEEIIEGDLTKPYLQTISGTIRTLSPERTRWGRFRRLPRPPGPFPRTFLPFYS